MKKRSWHTKEWKDKRKEFIKDKCCESCGSMNPPMVVQHKIHPPPKFEIIKMAGSSIMYEKIKNGIELLPNIFKRITEYADEAYVLEINENEFLKKYESKIPKLYCCPHCKKVNYRKNPMSKYYPNYKCYVCHEEFQTLDEKPDDRVVGKIMYKINSEYFKKLFNKYRDEIEIETKKIEDYWNKRYLSFIDAVVYCKRCAFAEDIKGLILCHKCKSKYHNPMYACCFNCLPNDRKKEAMDEQEREWEKEMDEQEREGEKEMAFMNSHLDIEKRCVEKANESVLDDWGNTYKGRQCCLAMGHNGKHMVSDDANGWVHFK